MVAIYLNPTDAAPSAFLRLALGGPGGAMLVNANIRKNKAEEAEWFIGIFLEDARKYLASSVGGKV